MLKTLLTAIVIGAVVTTAPSAVAAPASSPAPSTTAADVCPQDTHWSEELSMCVNDTHW